MLNVSILHLFLMISYKILELLWCCGITHSLRGEYYGYQKNCALFRHCFVLTKREIVTMIIMRLYLKSWMPFFGTFSIFQLKISVAQIETNLRFTASDYRISVFFHGSQILRFFSKLYFLAVYLIFAILTFNHTQIVWIS